MANVIQVPPKVVPVNTVKEPNKLANFYTMVETSTRAGSLPAIRNNSSDMGRPDDLRAVLSFKLQPSDLLTEFYDYLRKKERSEENLEFWLALRNHNLLYKRYRRLHQRQTQHPNEIAVTSASFQRHEKQLDLNLLLGVPEGENAPVPHKRRPSVFLTADITETEVDRKLLRKSVKMILALYLTPGSVKEVNVPNDLRQKVKQHIDDDKRYDPMIFAAVRESVFDTMRKDSYLRFLKYRQQNVQTAQ